MAPTTLREYLQTTEDAIGSGSVDDALAKCQLILTHFPEALEAQRLLGEVYLAQGQLEEAQQAFDWVLTNDPENVVAYCSRALISERLSDYDTALDCYQQAYELSRGNGQIRQQFNQLSEKVGQQGFIFSRAGLARLYMRGDLLPQAIQEWEAVLTSTPERLDARLGLLEAYWREELYDRVEQLATQILNEVAGCLKALLLLAHVTFAQNALQSQELIQQARVLDPDLVMAQELFSDFMVSQPKDPFLILLRKTTTVFPETSNGKSTAENVAGGPNGVLDTATFSEPLVRWNNLDNIIEPRQDYQAGQDVASQGSSSSNGTAEYDSWSSVDEQGLQSMQEAPTHAVQSVSSKAEADFDTWETLNQDVVAQQELEGRPWYGQQEGDENNESGAIHEQADADQQPWYHMEVFEEPDVASWSNTNDIAPAAPTASWPVEEQEEALPAPPAWLDMLTREERRHPAVEASTTSPVEQEPLTIVVKPSQQQNAEALPDTEMPGAEPADKAAVASSQLPQEEEPFFFGPEWLKSLGATSMDSTRSPQTDAPAPTDAPEELAQTIASESVVASAASDQPETKQKTSIETWLDQAAKKLAQPDQNLFATLEELENNLRTEGFTQLEPGTLSTLARGQEPTLSSALAQLGNLGPQPIIESAPAQAAPAETTTAVPAADPLWPATSAAFAQEESQPVVNAEQIPTATSHLDALARYVSTQNASEGVQPVLADALSSLASNTEAGLPLKASPTPGAFAALPEDSELETTMKRPAVRLQPMQQRSSVQQNQTKGRSVPGKTAEGSLSYKERLLRGYQCQLAGAYDDAMQEYRVIIRNAPEFLSDVVSNMRALLKLAPKYSAGYRVLGDAYMRQGEYLQAMEAYNKALAMAKKAKG